MFIFSHLKALLRGALSQQSAVILVCMAADRYMCAMHPLTYHQHSSKKVNYLNFDIQEYQNIQVSISIFQGLCRNIEYRVDFMSYILWSYCTAKR